MKKYILLILAGACLVACTATVDGSGAPNIDQQAQDQANKTPAPPVIVSLATSAGRACAIGYGQVKCWGEGDHKYINDEFKKLKNPRQVSIEASRICVLHESGVKCAIQPWTNYGYLPPLTNPREITADGTHTCALHDGGVSCWGDPGNDSRYWSTFEIPKLKNPTHIAAGWMHTCALTDEGIKCWGTSRGLPKDVTVKNPKQLAMSSDTNCVLGDSGVQCWSYAGIDQTAIDRLNKVNPRKISITEGYLCVIGDEGITCAQNFSSHMKDQPPLFNAPNLISVGPNYACGADNSGIKCWGNNSSILKNIPVFEPPKPPVINPVLTYAQVAGGRCFKSWNWESATGMVCKTQNRYSFFSLINKDPNSFTLDLLTQAGEVIRYSTHEAKSVDSSESTYTLSLKSAKGDELTFEKIKFGQSYTQPDTGYVILNGNSGNCAPVVSGDRASCLKAMEEQPTVGDTIWIRPFTFPENAETSAGTCNIRAAQTQLHLVKFKITSESCEIGSRTYEKDGDIQFDLRDPKNFPSLSKPY